MTQMPVDVLLIDGTYELFRHFFAVPSRRNDSGQEVGALRGVLGSVIGLLEQGATHVAVATDHVISSFRNDLWPGYKDGSDIDPDIAQQFKPLEEGLMALGVQVWPMIEFEADDALAAGAAMASQDEPLHSYRHAPIEFCEVASMAMELLGSDCLLYTSPSPRDRG